MISANDVTLRLGKKALFEDVNIKFTEGNCYGVIGANGAGKSTFLKILSGSLETTSGTVTMTPGSRLSVLEQDHFKYDDQVVLDTVIQGNQRLYEVGKEKDALYGIPTELHHSLMSELNGNQKVKVLLARALFGNPDILLLDEPTNHLDLDAIGWLEEFLINFNNTVIVVSHDRYFLNKVCTHIADIDYGKIQLYAGNYDFWYESSQLMIRQMKEANKKKEEKIKQLQEFIQRFSANASKSKQATSRKRALEKIQLDDIRPSSRKYPYIDFRPEREIGNEVLMVENLSKTVNGVKILDNITFTLGHDDKVAFVGGNEQAKTMFFRILMGEEEPDEGHYKWGVTTTRAYFPKDYTKEFDNDLTIAQWLTQYSAIKDQTYVRGFLGRMLFAGDDGDKKVRVLSGGEKVRCLFSKMMISASNVLFFDEPTNHLDMESITALNNGMIRFSGVLLLMRRRQPPDHSQPDYGNSSERKAGRQDHDLRRISGERRHGQKENSLYGGYRRRRLIRKTVRISTCTDTYLYRNIKSICRFMRSLAALLQMLFYLYRTLFILFFSCVFSSLFSVLLPGVLTAVLSRCCSLFHSVRISNKLPSGPAAGSGCRWPADPPHFHQCSQSRSGQR